jgi:hypothetical protein
MHALGDRTMHDKESLKRYMTNNIELEEKRIGQLASLALKLESAKDVRCYHGNTGNRATDLEWPQQLEVET